MSEAPQVMSIPSTLNAKQWLLVGLSLILILVFLLSPTSFPLGKMDTIAYAVCHRIPERSFIFNGQPLPLCARCSGTFIGILLTLVTLTLAGRGRAGRLPSFRVLFLLAGFVLLWAFDGLNSYLTLFPGAPHLYEPQNWLRLVTGMLNGLALGTLAFSIFQISVWRNPYPRPAIRGIGELAGLVALAALMVAVVLTDSPHLLYPLALVSTLGVVAMLTSVNTIVVLIIAHRENSAQGWRDTAWPLLVALALSLAIIMGIGAGRAAVSESLNIPF